MGLLMLSQIGMGQGVGPVGRMSLKMLPQAVDLGS